MKNIKLFALLAIVAMVSLASCKNDATAKKADETKESLATTATTAAKGIPASSAEPEVPVGPLTTIEFEENTYDFGQVMEGEKVVHVYKFKNTGKEPLVISNAKGSCGCTVPDWPREPIAVGGSGEIRVQFDSRGKGQVGGALKTNKVTLTANTNPQNTYLTLKGKVDKKEEAKPAS